VDNNYLDLGMNKSGFVHTLPSGRLSKEDDMNESQRVEKEDCRPSFPQLYLM
jgi:hypothetical protein